MRISPDAARRPDTGGEPVSGCGVLPPGQCVDQRLEISQENANLRESLRQLRAMEQENRAKVTENRSRLVLAEAEVPRAMADAFRKGNMHSQYAGNGDV